MCSLVCFFVFIRGTTSTVFPTLLGHPLEFATIISSVISWFFSIYYTNSTLNIIMNLLVNQTVCILHGLDGKYSYDTSSVHLIYKSESASWQIRKRAPWLTPSVSTALFACHKDRANFTHSVHPGYVHACVWGLISCSPQCTSSENRVMLLIIQSSTDSPVLVWTKCYTNMCMSAVILMWNFLTTCVLSQHEWYGWQGIKYPAAYILLQAK